MRRYSLQWVVLVLLVARAAGAQQRPVFDVDDFLDPRDLNNRTLLTSRLVMGVAKSYIDDFRPLHEDVAFVHVANSLYWPKYQLQLDYKHSEVRAQGKTAVRVCVCGNERIYFPTPPPDNATPAAPTPGSRETVQFGFYRSKLAGPAEPPIMLRTRLSWSHQAIRTVVTAVATGEVAERLSGRERSFGLDTDTHFRIRERDFFGSVLYARTTRTGTTNDRSQHELAYTARFRAWALNGVLFRPTLTLGAVSGRGASGINVVNPALEVFWRERKTRANVHLIYSPQAALDGAEGWRTTHQIALFVDRALYTKLFGARKN